MGSDSYLAPEAPRSWTGTMPAKTAEARCSWTGTMQAQNTHTTPNGLAPSALDPSREYSTDNMVLFSQPPSYFSQWSPSSFVVDGVSYSGAEQYIMAERATVFKDHRAV